MSRLYVLINIYPPNHILTIGIMQPPMRQVISLLLFILTFKAFYSRLAKVTRMI